ncbi:hypothetical protein [Hymenobacter elongatus]|uniref:Uncharacterized protein n=1 Tax=Hymenobacter elongatus TaxID=877208 RepID=A0A4Z0PE36_9BACT|nr:hypothetical protein [Hymenobacter elongatus]TGE11911.1 hypothetical protein E5J99_20615 [Hymenobacter elongatus]
MLGFLRWLLAAIFHCLKVIRPSDTDVKTIESSFLALNFLFFFLLVPIFDVFKYVFGFQPSPIAVVGTWILICAADYPFLIAKGKWRKALQENPIKPLTQFKAVIYISITVIVGFFTMFIPLGRILSSLF